MTTPSIWLIRAALLYLILGFSLGALLLWNKGVPIHPLIWQLLPAHLEFLLLGWTAQLAMGVAYWILPRFQTRRGNTGLVWTAFALLNIGIWVAVLSPFSGNQFATRLAARSAESAAFLAFLMHAWPRVKAPGVRRDSRPDTGT